MNPAIVLYVRRRPCKQQGVVLIIALALLVVIGFSSAFILRGTLFNGLISQNQSANQAAHQAAEIALRFCEQQVLAPTAGTPRTILPEPDNASRTVTAWRTQANWTANAMTVPTAPLANGNFTNASAVNFYAQPPQCLIERLPINSRTDNNSKRNFGFQITARGYSADYGRTSNGNITSGAEIILQSVLRLSTCSPLLNQPDCP